MRFSIKAGTPAQLRLVDGTISAYETRRDLPLGVPAGIDAGFVTWIRGGCHLSIERGKQLIRCDADAVLYMQWHDELRRRRAIGADPRDVRSAEKMLEAIVRHSAAVA